MQKERRQKKDGKLDIKKNGSDILNAEVEGERMVALVNFLLVNFCHSGSIILH